jgi:tetratricopeptide (TPR) repeat protein
MKNLIILPVLLFGFTYNTNAQANSITITEVEKQLEDVMEIIDTSFLKSQLIKVEAAYHADKSLINQIRLGIIYHELALSFGFFDSLYKGYPQKSLDVFNEVLPNLTDEMENYKPFVLSYKASALSLLSGETRKLGYLKEAYIIFDEAVEQYGHYSYIPEFMRGSVSENLPWIMFKKRSYAKKDFNSIIAKYEADSSFATPKIMSFTYWAWANQHQTKRDRAKALIYLERAIELDPDYNGGRKRAEELKQKFITG